MGIRIRKMLCYGLNDVQSSKYSITDPRFNKDFLEKKDDFDYHFDTKDYLNFLDSEIKSYKGEAFSSYVFNLKLDKKNIQDGLEIDFYNFYVEDLEYGLSNFVGFIPIGHKDWKRHDDIIDYYESDCKIAKPKIKEILGGIYPYIGNFYNLKTKEELGSEILEIIRYLNALKTIKNTSKKEEYIKNNFYFVREILDKLKFGSIEDFQKNIRPLVPASIRAMCKYLKVFNDPYVVYELKPYLYSYWS